MKLVTTRAMNPSGVTGQEVAVAKSCGQGAEGEAGAEKSFAAGPSVRYAYAKRSIDVLLALALIVATAPLLMLISVMIVLDGGRPVFYRQVRIGALGLRRGRRIEWRERRFRIVKFRTMVRNADSVPVHQRFIESFVAGKLDPSGPDGVSFKLCDDPRVTRIGRFLRASSLDELPQLFNVLHGTMSLVGPRPVPPYEVALYAPRHRERLAAMPGITGAWQVDGRGRVGFEEMVKLDIEYVRRHSLWLDLSLLLRTVPAVFARSRAK